MKDTARDFRAVIRRIDPVGRRYLLIEAQCPPDFQYSPGQFTKVFFADLTGSLERFYSIASAPRADGRFELCLTLDDPQLRQLLSTWTIGTTFTCSRPSGRFTIPAHDRPAVCVAGGSGITPIKAIIEDRVFNQARAPTVLLYGCQNDLEIPFLSSLRDLSLRTPLLSLKIFADEVKQGLAQQGRPLDHLSQFIIPKADYLLCGPPVFMEVAKRLLEQSGVAPEAIHQDRY